MRQTLFYINLELFGLPMFGLGWLMIAWAIFSVGLLVWLAQKENWKEEATAYLPFIGIGAVAIYVAQFIVVYDQGGEIIGLPVRGYGVMVLLGVVTGVAMAIQAARRMGVHPDYIWGLGMSMLFCGVVGARVFFVIQNRDQFPTLLDALMVTEGGLVVYGSLIGGVGAAVIYMVRNQLPMLAIADLIVPSMAIGLAFGRIGCLLNGCCWGGACDDAWWGMSFPIGSPPYVTQLDSGEVVGVSTKLTQEKRRQVVEVKPGSEAEKHHIKRGDRIQRFPVEEGRLPVVHPVNLYRPRSPEEPALVALGDSGEVYVWRLNSLPQWSQPLHPTQVFSAINALFLCFLLWALYPIRKRDGEIFALGIGVYAVTRFLLEMIRNDEPGRFGTGLTISQIVSLAMVAFAVALWCYVRSRPAKLALPR